MSNEIRRIAWIGAGVMGGPMAGHLLKHGYDLTVHTRTRDKAAALIEQGARWADSPREAAEGVDLAVSIVGFPRDVEAVHLGEHGTLAATRRPRFIMDMTTSTPSLAERLAARAREIGVGSIDAPVSGGDVGARNAALSIMVGAEEADVRAVKPVLEVLGQRIVYQGGPGAGQHTKMVNQILIASTMMGVCEGLLYAQRAGLDPLKVIESVGAGAAGSWTINNLGPRMTQRDFQPGFFVEHFLKDLGIALDEADAMRLSLPGLALARELYEAVRASGHARLGTQALLLVYEHLNSVEPGLAE